MVGPERYRCASEGRRRVLPKRDAVTDPKDGYHPGLRSYRLPPLPERCQATPHSRRRTPHHHRIISPFPCQPFLYHPGAGWHRKRRLRWPSASSSSERKEEEQKHPGPFAAPSERGAYPHPEEQQQEPGSRRHHLFLFQRPWGSWKRSRCDGSARLFPQDELDPRPPEPAHQRRGETKKTAAANNATTTTLPASPLIGHDPAPNLV